MAAAPDHSIGSALDDASLRAHLRACLAPFKIPSKIHLPSPLPAATTTGKRLEGPMKTMGQQPAGATAAPAAP